MSNKKDREDGMKLLKREIESNDVELTGGKLRDHRDFPYRDERSTQPSLNMELAVPNNTVRDTRITG